MADVDAVPERRPAMPGGEPSSSPTSSPADGLARFATLDAVISAAASLSLLLTWLFVDRSPIALTLAAVVGCGALLMLVPHLLLRRGRLQAAVALLAAVNWWLAITTTAMAPFAMPLLLIATLLPPAFAIQYVTPRAIRVYIGIAFVVSLVVALLGTLQDVTRFSEGLPGWMEPAVLVTATPFMALLLVVVAHQAYQALARSESTLAEQAMDLQRSRARLVAVADDERRAIERDLHDGAQQRLTAVAVGLGRLAERVRRGNPATAQDLDDLREHLAAARAELKTLARGVYPASLAQQGLMSALRLALTDTAAPVRLDGTLSAPLSQEAERALYFCCLEALHNAATHAGDGATVRVVVSDDATAATLTVIDDGPGFDPTATQAGRGLQNMADRAGAVGGTFHLRSQPGGGTAVVVCVPITRHTGPEPGRARTT